VEEFLFARAQERQDVLEVRRGARCGAKCRRIEWASPRGQKEDARETAADLEPTRAEVLVRNAVPRDVENRPKNECGEPGTAGGAGRSACRHVEGNYHAPYLAESPQPPLKARKRREPREVRGRRKLVSIGSSTARRNNPSRAAGGKKARSSTRGRR
jgi:hypothetical protein